ncbi:histone deacetylase domain protein [Mycobacterium xenopi 4042]|uniref:Histone deacetylase domain protein n=1 Tax=Mycobacterium xenopi 4042 TaxID=1299334 RepID=X8C8N9_MYCXE|nr:histone deacetylase domain protein [Mycobacterium xenopi 4042]
MRSRLSTPTRFSPCIRPTTSTCCGGLTTRHGRSIWTRYLRGTGRPDDRAAVGGGVIAATDAVLGGAADNGLAAIRRRTSCDARPRHGFCLLGNVAIAARHAKTDTASNGSWWSITTCTTAMAPKQCSTTIPRCCTSRHTSTRSTRHRRCQRRRHGRARVTRSTSRCPPEAATRTTRWCSTRSSGRRRAFRPELILVSVGFDAYWADPLAAMRLTLNGYSRLAEEVIGMARRWCAGKIVFALEGGYDLDALRYGVANVARLLLDERRSIRRAHGRAATEPDIDASLHGSSNSHAVAGLSTSTPG